VYLQVNGTGKVIGTGGDSMSSRFTAALITFTFFFSVPSVAHHSFAATYLDGQDVTLEGKMVRVTIRNPHSYAYISVEDEAGAETEWAIEWSAATRLLRDGLTRSTLRPGDAVVVTGSPSRNPSANKIIMRHIVRPADGWEWGGVVE
jgi:hypothetical protein